MSDFYNNLEQKSTETIFDYMDRLHKTWLEQKKSTDKRNLFWTEKCFIIAFINGLYNNKVKSKMNKWYEENPNSPNCYPNMVNAVFIADDYQMEENTKNSTEDAIYEVTKNVFIADKYQMEENTENGTGIIPIYDITENFQILDYPLSTPKEGKTINDVQVKAIKDDKTNDKWQGDAIRISANRIIIHEYALLNHKKAKFAIVEYLCPLGYDNALICSNKNFEKPEKVKNHLLWFHRVPPLKIEYGHYMGLNFTPIERITYKY